MASPAQIAANRANAIQSTGPRTGEGKAASRANALRHGIDARLPVIPGEDPAELEALTRDYYSRLRPEGPEQTFLVDTMIQADWGRRRLLRIETELTSILLAESEPCASPLGALIASDSPGARALERVMRHYENAQRAWFRACKELERRQSRAAEEAVLQMPLPTPSSENWLRSVNFEPAPPTQSPETLDPVERDRLLALRL